MDVVVLLKQRHQVRQVKTLNSFNLVSVELRYGSIGGGQEKEVGDRAILKKQAKTIGCFGD